MTLFARSTSSVLCAAFLFLACLPSTFAAIESGNKKLIDPFDVQQALAQAGYYQGPIDGIIGRNTQAALRAFQKDQGLKADGICGPKTWARLQPYAHIESKSGGDLSMNPMVEEAPPGVMEQEDRELTQDELKRKLIP